MNFLYTLKERWFPERKFRTARVWSNRALKEIAHLFEGNIINVSGWKDEDKRGGKYADYFINKSSYSISNYTSAEMGYQGNEGEIQIDLEKDLNPKYTHAYDVVFNHTTLEHIFDVRKAFQNLCLLSKDIVIVIVPWLQQLHYSEGYKDYWRISPYSIKRMFEENGFALVHLCANNSSKDSVYILAVGAKNESKWKDKLCVSPNYFHNLGDKIIT